MPQHATLAGMSAPKGRKSPPKPFESDPSTETPGVIHVDTTPSGLHLAVSLARLSARSQEGPGDDWISDTSHILYGLERAIYGISWAGRQPLNGSMPDADVSKRLLENMRDLALDFLAENGYYDRPKYTRIKDFKKDLVGYMLRLDCYRIPGDWNEHDCFALAMFLQTGTILFPRIVEQPFESLKVSLLALGPGFLKKTKTPADRIEKVFLAAGLLPADVWRLLDAAKAKYRSRGRAAEKPGG